MSTDGDSTLSNTIDKLVPVTSDGNPIIWMDDNDAHIEGLLHEVGKFYRRTGRFQYFFKHHAAALPNGKLADMRTETVSARDRYRVHATLGLEHGTPSATLRAVIDAARAMLAAHPRAHEDTPWVFLRRIGESSLDVEVSAWFNADGYEDFLAIRSEVLMRLLEVVEARGARLAFPTRTVHVAASHEKA